LSRTLEYLQIKLVLRQSNTLLEGFVGWNGSLKKCIEKAQRSIASLGGPRHSIISGQTGTGKTMLAKATLVQHQTMLLKLIESGTVRRIGGRSERKVDVINLYMIRRKI
jgi:transcriptional regulator with AAA-type ATPase domain